MISTNVTGAAAYAAIQGGSASGAASTGASGSFGDALQGAMNNLFDLGHTADAKSAQAMTGGGNMTDVVMAVSKAEDGIPGQRRRAGQGDLRLPGHHEDVGVTSAAIINARGKL